MIRRVRRTCAVAVVALTTALAAQSNLVDEVRGAIAGQDLARAERIARDNLVRGRGDPEALEALSWVARGALAASDFSTAARLARDTETRVEAALKTRPLDRDAHLPIALGAAIEVQAQVLVAQGNRSDAVYLLTHALERYGKTSIQERIQKNIHLLSLAGRRAIPLDAGEFLGTNRASLDDLKARPVVLFFWAHWCSDCKFQGPILADLLKEFARDGLTVIAPTKRYGYIGARDVSPDEERRHIALVRDHFYEFLGHAPIPLSTRNFQNYGVSSTPTIVLVDRQGIVRLYHPGRMTRAELRPAIRAVISRRTGS